MFYVVYIWQRESDLEALGWHTALIRSSVLNINCLFLTNTQNTCGEAVWPLKVVGSYQLGVRPAGQSQLGSPQPFQCSDGCAGSASYHAAPPAKHHIPFLNPTRLNQARLKPTRPNQIKVNQTRLNQTSHGDPPPVCGHTVPQTKALMKKHRFRSGWFYKCVITRGRIQKKVLGRFYLHIWHVSVNMKTRAFLQFIYIVCGKKLKFT